ncbi:ABC transporter ATP-binding protein [Cohaesibacter intestini]|uniref:ABC transporter ATP-binding protein n=1 Tax=Cohaesibacter intestini TaxID=2211145 RepID=UPI000DE8E27A|nr:ABC transporter ATP-binding protein [Cohaesibacter intestini]
MTNINIQHANKAYSKGGPLAVADLNLDIPESEFLCLLGPSGCGKSTTLRMIAGLENLTSGQIQIGNRVVDATEDGIFVPAEKRNLGMVFQNYALWPHMSIKENIEFGLKIKKVAAAERETIIEKVLKTLGIYQFKDRYPSEVSGGQQQRVALARMIAVSPDVILLDEPLSNLDAKLRLDMRAELKRIHTELGSTFIFVTHDQWEAMTLATTIAVMNEGRLQQVGPPEDIYDRPANRFVAEFVGTLPINILETSDLAKNPLLNDWVKAIWADAPLDPAKVGSVGIRPETIELFAQGVAVPEELASCSATILDLVPTGGNWIVELNIDGTRLFALKRQVDALSIGASVHMAIGLRDLHIFDTGGDRITASDPIHKCQN